MYKKRIIYSIAFLIPFILIGCSTSSTSKFVLTEEHFPPRAPDEKIEEYFSPPSRPYTTIGIVTAETPLFSYVPYAESYNTLKELLKEEARKLGADGIIDIKITQEERPFATVFTGHAKAIRLIEDVDGKEELDDVDYSIRELLETYEIVSSFKDVLKAIENKPKNSNNYILLGNIYSKKGELDKAIEYYKRSIDLNSNNPVAYRALAKASKKKGMLDEAVRSYKNIIEIDQDTIFDHYDLANLYIKKGKFDKAVTEFLNVSQFVQSGDRSDVYQDRDVDVAFDEVRQSLDIEEGEDNSITSDKIDDIWVLESIGYLLYISGDYEGTINYFKRAKSISPDLFKFYFEMGYSYLESDSPNRISNAFSNIRKAIEINPSSYSAHIVLGRIYLLDNSLKRLTSLYDSAIKEFAKAIELDHSKPEGYYYLGMALRYKGDYENALKVTQKAIDISPQYISAIEQAGDIYLTTKLYDKALENYLELLDNSPNKVEIHEKIGAVYELKGDYERAINEYRRVYRLTKDNIKKVEIHGKIGAVYELKGDYESAITEYEKVYRLTHDNTKRGEIHGKIGAVYELKGDYESAIAEYEKAYELNNVNKFIEYIADAYRKEGNYEAAIETVQRLIELDERNSQYHFSLAYLYEKENRLADAISEYNMVIELKPKATDVRYNLGVAYINNKEKDKAVRQFKKYLELTRNMPEKKEWRERAKGIIFNIEYPRQRRKFADIGIITTLLSAELEYTKANHLFITGVLDTTPKYENGKLSGYSVSPKIQEAKGIFKGVRESINNLITISEDTREIKNLFLMAASEVEEGIDRYLRGYNMKKTLRRGKNEEGLTKIRNGNRYFLNGLNLLKEIMADHNDLFNDEYITHIDATIKYFFSKIGN